MKDDQVRKIIRKRNYGFLRLIDDYVLMIQETVYHKAEIKELVGEYYESLTGHRTPVTVESLHTLNDRLNSRMNKLANSLNPLFTKVRQHGANKVLDTKGNVLKFKVPTYVGVLNTIVKNNLAAVDRLSQYQKNSILKSLTQGIKDGLTYNQMAKSIVEDTEAITINRAQLIAITEVSRAHAQAQRDVMAQNGIKQYRWLTARDRVVCDLCKSLEQGGPYNANDPNSPTPVESTHPRCRCVVCAVVR